MDNIVGLILVIGVLIIINKLVNGYLEGNEIRDSQIKRLDNIEDSLDKLGDLCGEEIDLEIQIDGHEERLKELDELIDGLYCDQIELEDRLNKIIQKDNE